MSTDELNREGGRTRRVSVLFGQDILCSKSKVVDLGLASRQGRAVGVD
jgi:hypothetical protein